MAKQLIILVLLASIITGNSYKILGIFPSLDRNNFFTYKNFVKELADRNHEVTLISHFQIETQRLKNVLLSDNKVYKGLSYESVIDNEISRVPFETLMSTKSGNGDCKVLMNNQEVLKMLKTRPKFDVVIVESYNSDCGIALAANLSAPYIAFNPQPLQPWQYSRSGVNFNSASTPQSNLEYGKDPWFLDRLRSCVLYYLCNLAYYVCSQVTDHVYLYKYLGDDLPALESIASNVSVMFVNTHASVFGGIARADNVIDVGGIHLRPHKPIPAEIESFINKSEHGVIYVNLGSTKASTLPKDKLQELLSVFKKLPFSVLWKWDGGYVELPSNVMTMRWFPQYDILNHPKVKVFISHTGILSTIEALDTGVPVVAIPLFENQYGNAAALQDAGVAIIVAYQNLKKEFLMDAIDDVLGANYQERAKKVSELWRDRPMLPLESAIYWTEYVARHQGAPNLAATSVTKPWYQQLQVDVLAFIFLVIYILTGATVKILSFCCCCCCNNDAVSHSNLVEERRSKRVKFE